MLFYFEVTGIRGFLTAGPGAESIARLTGVTAGLTCKRNFRRRCNRRPLRRRHRPPREIEAPTGAGDFENTANTTAIVTTVVRLSNKMFR